MDWFLFAPPVPGVLELWVATGLVWVAALFVALVPAVLLVRQVFRLGMRERPRPLLRVVESGNELERRAA